MYVLKMPDLTLWLFFFNKNINHGAWLYQLLEKCGDTEAKDVR